MAAKKPRGKAPRKGISGNPQRRAEQLAQRQQPDDRPDLSGLRGLAYAVAGGAAPRPWWSESHNAILAAAKAVSWPSRLVDAETQACQIVGDEFYRRLNSSQTGLHPTQWLRVLVEETGAKLRTSVVKETGEWRKLWSLLCGLALIVPPRDTESDSYKLARAKFPDIEDPDETAMAEMARAGKLLANRGLVADIIYPVAGCRPAGEPSFAGDAYGSRFLLTAPFSYDGGSPDHWYAWDIDMCWVPTVVAAGAFESAAAALAEWQEAVGPAAGTSLTPSVPETTAELLAPSLQTGFLAYRLQGNEPLELIRELYRHRRRARVLVETTETAETVETVETKVASSGEEEPHEAFLDWYAVRHGDVPQDVADAAGTIAYEWGPSGDQGKVASFACSPHRIEMAAHLIRNGSTPEYANPALRLLPEWTQYCIERTGLGGDFAVRSRDASLTEAAGLLADDNDSDTAAKGQRAPFRRRE